MNAQRIVATVTALAAGALLVGTAVVGTQVGTATTVAAEPTSVTVTPAVQPAACTGELTVPVGSIEGDDFSSEPTVRSRDLFGVEAVTDGAEAGDGLFGASIERVQDGDIAGYAALACGTPSTSQWLVGGSTSLGSSARLVLANPTQSNVEATVTLYGGSGQIDAQTVVAVGAGGIEDLLLEAVQEGIEATAVRVESTGAGVVAALQDSELDGLQPAGTSWVASVSDLGTSLVVPAVAAVGLESSAVLRLVASEGATVSLTLANGDGAVEWSGVAALELDPGVVTEVEIPESSGSAVVIDSDAPVAAAAEITVARSSDIGEEGSVAHDRTWVPAEEVPATYGENQDDGVYWPGDEGVLLAYTAVATTLTVLDDAGEQIAQTETRAGVVTRIPVEGVSAGTRLTLQGRAAWSLQIVGDGGFLASMRALPATVLDVDLSVVDAPYLP
ncbi:DUF5719 family protein [Demequina salsinemoris]|uniref:DUF5719 family protein n=1 Tax=Demequina salsinemoris TaxID=577470 RepID=UPI00078191EE|nr:DUF5719 family protein [Demequina salsinemoris]